VTTRNVGMLLTVVGSALGAWWLVMQRARMARLETAQAGRGTVIYHNRPEPSEAETII
jgi:hypothetical protein